MRTKKFAILGRVNRALKGAVAVWSFQFALALFLMLSVTITALGQTEAQSSTDSSLALTLDKCIQLGLEVNHSLLVQRESLIRASASRLGSWSSFLPGASARVSWSHSGEEGYSFSESGLTLSREYYSAGLSASYTIFTGGQNYFDLRNSYLSYRASEATLDETQAVLIYSIKTAFFGVISARQTEKNMQHALERTRDQMVLVTQRDSLGMADPTEVTQIKVSLAETELAALQAANARKKAEQSLLALLSYPLDVNLDLVEPQREIEHVEPLENYLSQALDYNPQVRTAEIALKQTKLSRLSSWGDYLPSASASYSYNWGDSELPGSFSEFDDEASWSVGIYASWTLFSGTSRIYSLKYSSSNLREAEIGLAMAKQSVEVDVRDAYRAMTEAAARIKLAEARYENAQLNLTLFKEKFELGDCTLLELLQAELTLREAEAERISAEFDYQTSIAELERLTGGGE